MALSHEAAPGEHTRIRHSPIAHIWPAGQSISNVVAPRASQRRARVGDAQVREPGSQTGVAQAWAVLQ